MPRHARILPVRRQRTAHRAINDAVPFRIGTGVRSRGEPMSEKELPDVPGVADYEAAAGGWGALGAVARAISGQLAFGREALALHRMNQPTGFDCPGCAWPD